MKRSVTRRGLADLIELASEGHIGAADALAGTAPLGALGLTSLGFIRLVDVIDIEYGVELDIFEDPSRLDTFEGLVTMLTEQGLRFDERDG